MATVIKKPHHKATQGYRQATLRIIRRLAVWNSTIQKWMVDADLPKRIEEDTQEHFEVMCEVISWADQHHVLIPEIMQNSGGDKLILTGISHSWLAN